MDSKRFGSCAAGTSGLGTGLVIKRRGIPLIEKPQLNAGSSVRAPIRGVVAQPPPQVKKLVWEDDSAKKKFLNFLREKVRPHARALINLLNLTKVNAVTKAILEAGSLVFNGFIVTAEAVADKVRIIFTGRLKLVWDISPDEILSSDEILA